MAPLGVRLRSPRSPRRDGPSSPRKAGAEVETSQRWSLGQEKEQEGTAFSVSEPQRAGGYNSFTASTLGRLSLMHLF